MTSPKDSASTDQLKTTTLAPWHQDRVLLLVMLIAAVLGLIYNGTMILGKGADEPRHMAYVRLLLNEHTLPYLEPDPHIPGKMREHAGAHSLHPPLYYLLLLPFYAIFRGLGEGTAWHVARVVSLLLCLGALPLIYQIAMRAGSLSRNRALLAVAHAAFLPIFGMTAGTINNDSATLLAVVAFLWLLAVKYPEDHTVKSAVIIGICFGIGALCKATALLCNGAALVVYLLVQDDWRTALRSRQTWTRLAVVALLVGLIAGPWYGRNFNLYHKLTPIEPGYSTADLRWLPGTEQGLLVAVLHENFPPLFGRANWSIFYTMWSQKDWIPEAIRSLVYGILVLYCLGAVAGVGLRQVRKRKSPQIDSKAPVTLNSPAIQRVGIYSSYGAFVINWLACLFIALFVHWGWAEGGRYLLPALCGLSIFLARGWEGLVGEQRLMTVTIIWSSGLLMLNGIAIYWLLSYLNPTFGSTG